jgi:thioredoxin reductase (NADPH)
MENTMSGHSYDVIVVGSGITGLAAARQLLQSGLSVGNVEAQMFGGLVININELDGAITGSGVDFASNLMMEVSELGAETISEPVSALAHDGRTWSVTTDSATHQAKAVIVASGARLKRLGIPGEAEFEYKGVAQCADCDGPMYVGKDVVVAGGGDSALQEALVLAQFSSQVHLLCRDTAFKARPHLVAEVNATANISVRFSTEVKAILGSDGVEKIQVENLADHTTEEIACSGFFGYIGLEPSAEFVPPEVARDAHGFLVTDPDLKTPLQGLFAAGAVRSGYGGMLEHALAEGIAAAKGAAQAARA